MAPGLWRSEKCKVMTESSRDINGFLEAGKEGRMVWWDRELKKGTHRDSLWWSTCSSFLRWWGFLCVLVYVVHTCKHFLKPILKRFWQALLEGLEMYCRRDRNGVFLQVEGLSITSGIQSTTALDIKWAATPSCWISLIMSIDVYFVNDDLRNFLVSLAFMWTVRQSERLNMQSEGFNKHFQPMSSVSSQNQ